MTDMKRITVSLTDDIDEAIREIRASEHKRLSYSAAIRMLVERGLEVYKTAEEQPNE